MKEGKAEGKTNKMFSAFCLLPTAFSLLYSSLFNPGDPVLYISGTNF
jgi:hypothetical protein